VTTTLTAKEAAGIIGISRPTLIRYVHAGRIKPERKLDGKTGPFLFQRATVEAFKASHQAAAS
jgi:excisionase family DNA binding protein